ncbi:putative hyaluronan/mRNA-binding protein [Dioscorea sansibarensis]
MFVCIYSEGSEEQWRSWESWCQPWRACQWKGARGGRNGPNREFRNGNTNGFAEGYGAGEDGDAVKPFEREKNYDGGRGAYGGRRQSSRGGWRGGYGNGEVGGDSERAPRRNYERRSGTGRGHEMKREGAG